MSSDNLFFPYNSNSEFYIIKKNKSGDVIRCELDLPVPPKDLWLGYGENADEYLRGKVQIKQMLDITALHGYNPSEPGNILDFGCGAGRMIRWLKPYSDNKEIWGVDISSEHILWANNNLNPPFNFAVNTTIPHLPFRDGFFDFIYAGSVFTHIDDLADSWFLELNRISSDKAFLYLTVQDRNTIELLNTKYKEQWLGNFMRKFPEYELEKENYNIMVGGRGPASQVFYDIDYLKRVLNKVYDFVSINEEAYGYQTALLLKKKKTNFSTPVNVDLSSGINPKLISDLKNELRSELKAEFSEEFKSELKAQLIVELNLDLKSEKDSEILYFPYNNTSEFYLIGKDIPSEFKCEQGLPVPPKDLWLGYGETVDDYLKGKVQVKQMLNIAEAYGYNPNDPGNILDFGCGAGRMLRWLKPYTGNKEIWGVDISSEHIIWANSTLNPPFNFAVNTTIPHLPFQDGYFNFIYAGSVFTHIDDLADSWFLELSRVCSDDAFLYLTIQDRNTIELLDTKYREQWLGNYMRKFPQYESEKDNFNIMVGGRGPASQVFYDIKYIKRVLNNVFEFVAVKEEAYGYQTALVLKKKKTAASSKVLSQKVSEAKVDMNAQSPSQSISDSKSELKTELKTELSSELYSELRREFNADKLYFPYKDTSDFYLIKKENRKEEIERCELGLPIPPMELWLGYGENNEEYLRGKIQIKQMLDIAAAKGYNPENPGNILDFGCGAGRMLRWLKPYADNKEIWGVDISAEHILWANSHLNPPFNFAVNTFVPHLPFKDGFFDFIYAGSVFTHIDDLADSWFLELNRISSDNAYLYLTVQDRHTIELLDTVYKEKNLTKFMEKYPEYETEKENFNIMVGGRGPGSQVFYDIDYLKKVLGNVYEFSSVNQEAYGYQTALLLRKKSGKK